MKSKIILLLSVLVAFCGNIFAQAPQKFNYQGIARNGSGQPLASQSLGLKISVLDGSSSGTAQYVETHTVTTNAYGLYNVTVGGGTIVTGTMSSITWNTGDKYIKVEMDPAGGTTYTTVGNTQLLSVPYAMLAAEGPATLVSAFQPTGCQTLAAVTTSYQKIANMGTFTKTNAGGFIELNVQTMFYVAIFTTASSVIYELRIDDVATTFGNATIMLRAAAAYVPGSITGVFSGLAAGSHTVSLWAKGVNGAATNAYWDAGCFNSFGTNNVLVKEYK